jgi:pimeloyl-ACP methyl ester carboxylesterase
VSIWTDLLGCQVHYLGSKYRTRVIEHGEGEPLVLLHGGGGHAEAWTKNVVRLGQHFRVLAIDMLWHGLSSKPPFSGQALATYGDQVLDLLDTLGSERAHLEGEAIGGRVALWLALHRPERVAKLVLNNSGGVRFQAGTVQEPEATRQLYQQSASAALQTPTRETVRTRFERLFVDHSLITDELVEVRYRFYTDPETAAAQAAIRMDPEVDEAELARITVPTLVLATDHNPLRGPDAGERMASLIPGARFQLIPGAAIWLQWEQAEEHDRVVTEFLLAG